MKLYIAGPMYGLPENNYPAFFAAEERLNAVGFQTENPARNENPTPEDYYVWLRLGLQQVLVSDGVALLPNFGMSKGATMELFVASFLKMPVRPILDWIEMAEAQEDSYELR